MRRLGIMQGRLSPKAGKNLQSFPEASWRDEFRHARAFGLGAIEWLVDSFAEDDNPLFDDARVSEIRALARDSRLVVESLCAHVFIAGDLAETGPEADAARAFLLRTLSRASLLGVRVVVLPLLETASIRGESRRRAALVGNLGRVLQETDADIRIALESDLDAGDVLDLLAELPSRSIGICCDLGNSVSFGRDLAQEIGELGAHICEVHIKDRARGGGSRRLGEGDVDFAAAFAALERLSI